MKKFETIEKEIFEVLKRNAADVLNDIQISNISKNIALSLWKNNSLCAIIKE